MSRHSVNDGNSTSLCLKNEGLTLCICVYSGLFVILLPNLITLGVLCKKAFSKSEWIDLYMDVFVYCAA